MRDHGIFGGSHDDSHAGAESFQWANRIEAPVTHTKAFMNVAPSESGTSRIPTLRNTHSISPSLVKNRNMPRSMGNGDRNKPAMTWTLRNAWPTKITGPSLNAKGNDFAVEQLDLAHERLEIT